MPHPIVAPRAAYVHVPFCRHHCGYCNFTVITGREDLVDPFLLGLEKECQRMAETYGVGPFEVDTLYIGGGTPSRLSPSQLRQLFSTLARWFVRAPSYEFTIEVNPDDIDADRVAALVEGGVNRVSLGVQSFSDAKLKALDRDHGASSNYRAIELLRPAFDQLSIDLIFAAPGERVEEWHAELAQGVRCQANHISTYGLTFERGTTYWGQLQKQRLQEVAEEPQRDMYLSSIEQLQAAGYQHYEVSNFAQPGCHSRHNESYWLGKRYAGIGPGASRFLGQERATNHGSTTTYIKRILAGEDPTVSRELLTADVEGRERVIFGLRRRAGIDLMEIARETGANIQQLVGEKLDSYVELGFLQRNGSRYWLTENGLLISDSLWPDLL